MAETVVYIVGDLHFEWDADKAAGNLEKHHVSFEEGATVFRDYNALLLDDPDHFDDEVRFAMLGYSSHRHLLIVVHVERGARFRIVSVRTPTKAERRLYEEKSKS